MKIKRTFTHQEHGTTCIPNDVPINVSSPKNQHSSTNNNQHNAQSEDLYYANKQKNFSNVKKLKKMVISLKSRYCLKGRDEFSLYIFSNDHK